jgi:hypothetical protein
LNVATLLLPCGKKILFMLRKQRLRDDTNSTVAPHGAHLVRQSIQQDGRGATPSNKEDARQRRASRASTPAPTATGSWNQTMTRATLT